LQSLGNGLRHLLARNEHTPRWPPGTGALPGRVVAARAAKRCSFCRALWPVKDLPLVGSRRMPRSRYRRIPRAGRIPEHLEAVWSRLPPGALFSGPMSPERFPRVVGPSLTAANSYVEEPCPPPREAPGQREIHFQDQEKEARDKRLENFPRRIPRLCALYRIAGASSRVMLWRPSQNGVFALPVPAWCQ
jgi:hypothetical protein